MFKFRALIQFSHNDIMYNPHQETYQLNDDVVREWEKHGYVKIVEMEAAIREIEPKEGWQQFEYVKQEKPKKVTKAKIEN